MNDNEVVIKLEGVSKKYKLFDDKKARMMEALHPLKKQYHKDFYALNNINLDVRKGEILGIVGMNGSGKSTMLKIISSIIQPSSGTVNVRGHVAPLLELGSGFNPEFTGLENIYFYNSIHGYNRKQTDAILDSILDFAEIGSFIHQPLKTYSSGMKARLSFAVSVNIDPDILILDEVLSVGDELFRRKCYAKMEEFFKGGKTILFVSHSADSINEMCSRAILLSKGQNILEGPAKLVTMFYQKLIYAKGETISRVLEEIKEINADDMKKNDFHIQESIDKMNNTSDKEKTVSKFKSELIPEQRPQNKFSQKSQQTAYFVDEFKPKSTVKYKNEKIEISNISIKTLDGRLVNQLVTGEDFIVHFVLKFHDCFENINTGISFKDEKGKIFSGMSLRNSDHIIPKVMPGNELNVDWKFTCLFTTGIYYIDIGVNQVNINGEPFLINYDDAINFKMIQNKENYLFKWGIIDFNISPDK